MRPLQHLVVQSAQTFHLWTLQVFWEIVHTNLGCTRPNNRYFTTHCVQGWCFKYMTYPLQAKAWQWQAVQVEPQGCHGPKTQEWHGRYCSIFCPSCATDNRLFFIRLSTWIHACMNPLVCKQAELIIVQHLQPNKSGRRICMECLGQVWWSCAALHVVGHVSKLCMA